ncbi:MAG: HAMP domain-containing histidine kinase [Nevskia sp.]|jgi:signal transduction histidine kinase|nr:HAMP domain-containing histidine kinase [Nevskia sp.]MCK9384219.1 HAMP domain-containing histidine kinase [Nevskia sp.]
MTERSPGHLRRRLAIALVSLTVAAAGVQGISYWVAEQWVERTSLERLLEDEMAHLVVTEAAPGEKAATDRALRYYRTSRGSTIPAALEGLDGGWHSDVELDNKIYQVLVSELPNQDRVFLLYDKTLSQGRERQLLLLFAGGVVVVALLGFWASQQLARRALAPLEILVGEIRRLDPEMPGTRLRLGGDRELRVIAEALNVHMIKLEALVERERAFAAAASHELRTPLAVISGAAELLSAQLPETSAPPLRRIERAVTQARRDLDALLALSRVREPPPASDLVLEQLLPEWAEPYIAGVSTQIVWQLQPRLLLAPSGSLNIVFTNVLRNALRAAGPNGEVTVLLDAQRISVEDNGPGIPAAELPRVFEPHFRGRDGGTGIGLYVAQALAHRHGWRLTLANREASGARAELWFDGETA